jgi:GTP-binding protein
MPGKHFLTLGNEEQISAALKGPFLKGKKEPRVAMVGRSNVGKSSLINALLGARLAQVSKEPGKTRLLHFYEWPETKRIIADLPGYGYARASAEDRNRWADFIQAYIENDEGLERALVLVDSRHGPTELDIEAIHFLQRQGVTLHLVFSKWDTLKTQSERAKRKQEVSIALKELRLAPHQASWVSSETGFGLRELTRLIGTAQES